MLMLFFKTVPSLASVQRYLKRHVAEGEVVHCLRPQTMPLQPSRKALGKEKKRKEKLILEPGS